MCWHLSSKQGLTIVCASFLSFFFFLMTRRPPRSTRLATLFPYTRSSDLLYGESLLLLANGRKLGEHHQPERSEEHTSELQSQLTISYAVFCLKKKNNI